jgi:hypothetical protein
MTNNKAQLRITVALCFMALSAQCSQREHENSFLNQIEHENSFLKRWFNPSAMVKGFLAAATVDFIKHEIGDKIPAGSMAGAASFALAGDLLCSPVQNAVIFLQKGSAAGIGTFAYWLFGKMFVDAIRAEAIRSKKGS